MRSRGYMEHVTENHLHDLGKYMFAFSIFWTYLWFSQFMLIWYANIPEETIYFVERSQGIYKGIFWIMFIINFVAPILILMSRDSKRNYATMSFMAILILFGHWLDFYQMVFPGVSPDHVPSIIYDMGVGLGFVGVIMFVTGRALTKAPLLAKNHPFVKESLIHHT
jgi:Ni/Fe-hydrogenase subunit HybB-like protein